MVWATLGSRTAKEQEQEPPKGTSVGHNGSGGVLIMSIFVIVPEKSRGNKKCDEEEEEEELRRIFGLFDITEKWP